MNQKELYLLFKAIRLRKRIRQILKKIYKIDVYKNGTN